MALKKRENRCNRRKVKRWRKLDDAYSVVFEKKKWGQ